MVKFQRVHDREALRAASCCQQSGLQFLSRGWTRLTNRHQPQKLELLRSFSTCSTEVDQKMDFFSLLKYTDLTIQSCWSINLRSLTKLLQIAQLHYKMVVLCFMFKLPQL